MCFRRIEGPEPAGAGRRGRPGCSCVDAVTHGTPDWAWLIAIFNKLVINYTWWMNRQDPEGNDLFGGGFLGLDNISPFDRSHPPELRRHARSRRTAPPGWRPTAWACSRWPVRLAQYNKGFQDVAVKFFEHFWRIASAHQRSRRLGRDRRLVLRRHRTPGRQPDAGPARSIVGVLPVIPRSPSGPS